MKSDIVIAGVGGQGALSVAAIIARCAVASGYCVKQTEVHGMAQKGGSVVSHLRIASDPIASDIVPLGRADLLIGVESLEALRLLPYLSSAGWALVSKTRIENVKGYPAATDVEASLGQVSNLLFLDTEKLAKEAGSVRAANTVLLGAASDSLPFAYEAIESAVGAWFLGKGEKVVDANIKALELGRSAMRLTGHTEEVAIADH